VPAFKLVSSFSPQGDQAQAIDHLTSGIKSHKKHQVLLGVTGSGKTYTIANLIQNTGLPTLVISHNKTLAAQLYQEFRDFFPQNAVSFFVSYYDYYQPEAYLPRSDTYIEKEADINEEIDKLRLAATTNLLTRPDSIVIASVSCIYNIGSPKEYGDFIVKLETGHHYPQHELLLRLSELQYQRADLDFRRGTFRLRGENLDIHPSYQDEGYRLVFAEDKLQSIFRLDPLTGRLLSEELPATVIYPAKHYLVNQEMQKKAFPQIKRDLEEEVAALKARGRQVEAQRLSQRVNYDLEMITEFGYVNGIENYSRYFDGRAIGAPPYTLLDYFPRPFLTVIDESHLTVSQVGGMYRGDRSRKQTLVDYGFRLAASFDNRPLKFPEFLGRLDQVIYTSATPGPWELEKAKDQVVEQLVRPTGLVDPEVVIRKSQGQIDDLLQEIKKRAKKKQRVLVTTLTKRMSEDLSQFLDEKGIKVRYLHSDIPTLERSDILASLRKGDIDALIGVNLLREGLDLPEVSLVVILDADKEGFLRSRTSLVQTMGRAARHLKGKIILYADTVTSSMQSALDEVNRRRLHQLDYNRRHHITPSSITKPIRDRLSPESNAVTAKEQAQIQLREYLVGLNPAELLPQERKKLVFSLRKEMRQAASDLNFELAIELRDKVAEVKKI